eukprot:scaffold33564_cov69-Phaeocystis_antarctica.AAC.2
MAKAVKVRNRQNGKAMKGRGNVVPRRRRCRLGRRLGRRYEYLEGTPGEIPHTIFPPLPLNISSTGDQYPFVSPALSACMRVVRTGTGPPPCAKSPGRLESWSNARGKCGRTCCEPILGRLFCCWLGEGLIPSCRLFRHDPENQHYPHSLCGRPLLHMTTPHHLMCTRASHTPPPALNPQPLTTQHLVFGREISESLLDFKTTSMTKVCASTQRHATCPTGPRSHAPVADATLPHSRLAAACERLALPTPTSGPGDRAQDEQPTL